MNAILLSWLHPRLPAMPAEARRSMLRDAFREPFDPLELVTVAAAVVLASWLRFAAAGWIALPLLACAAVLVRRCRRGLRRILAR